MTLVGRFAPSPTGPLHMGSLVTALASYLDIKSRHGQWFVRIDDLDPPRQDPTANGKILASLNAHGLIGDRPVDYQSGHQARYDAAFTALKDHLFYCTCTRKALSAHDIYPGVCRNHVKPRPNSAIRLRVADQPFVLDDMLLGRQHYNLGNDYGDFIVKRRDGLWAYNFATAVDDGFDVTHVLRGQDLFHVTPQQAYVIELLKPHFPDMTLPEYCHIPLLCFADGTKLSKQTHAPAIDDQRPAENLRAALFYLGFAPPRQVLWSHSQWLSWGLEHWDRKRIPSRLATYDMSL